MLKRPLRLLAAALLAPAPLALAAPAQAQSATATRAYVAGYGADNGFCGAAFSPCRTFQYVHDNVVAPGGEIDVLWPAGFGRLTITKAISIVNRGDVTAGVLAASAGANAITINAGPSDTVVLRGLTIDGVGVGAGGVVINSAASVTIDHCFVWNFQGDGISAAPSSGTLALFVSDTTASNNAGGNGIHVAPTASGVVKGLIKHVNASNNGKAGIELFNNSASGSVAMTIVASAANHNVAGFSISAIPTTGNSSAMLDGVTANANIYGLYVGAPAAAQIAGSTFTHNQVGVTTFGPVASFGDNVVSRNTSSDVAGALTPASFQ